MPAEKHDEIRHKMITNSKEENSPPKLAAASSSSSSAATPWLRLKDPRIVRVSRAFGGKDRHSKVCTIRGLRDRRVRLSVSTAIQLYDLQERLGLNQPSKVVDWLLNAAKDGIDELPPLPTIPTASLGLHYQSMLLPPHPPTTHPHRSEFKINNCTNNNNNNNGIDKADHDDDEAEDAPEQKQQHKSSNNSNPSHPSSSSSSFSALLNNVASVPPYGYHHHWEPSPTTNLPFFTSQAEDLHSFNNVNVCNLPSPLSLSTGSQYLEFNHHLHQNFLMNNSLTHNPLHSINQAAVRPFHFSMAPKFASQVIKNNTNKGDDDHFDSDDQ